VHQLILSGIGPQAQRLLHKYLPAPGEADVRSFAWHYLFRLCHDERRTLRGHRGAVYHAEFAPDGRTLVSCGQDRTLRFWDVASGRSLRVIAAHADEVNWAAYSPDGRSLATASDDGTVKLWDAMTGDEQASLKAHTRTAVLVRFLPDGRRLISAGRDDGLIKLWDLANLRELSSFRAHDREIENMAISPDGTILATVGGDGFARLWDLTNLGARPIPLEHGEGPVYGVAFAANGARLVTGDPHWLVRVWDLPGGRRRGDFRGQGHLGDVQSVAFLAGDRMIVSASGDASLRFWDVDTGRCLGTLLGHADKIWGVSVSPDGATLATASSDGTVKLWDARLPQHQIRALRGEGFETMALAFTPDGQSLIAARVVGRLGNWNSMSYVMLDAELRINGFNPITGAERFRRLLERRQRNNGTLLSPDGKLVVFMFPEGTATTWEVATGKRLATVKRIYPWSIHPLIQGHSAAVWGQNQPIELVDVTNGQAHRVLEGTESWGPKALSPRGDLLAVIDKSHALVVWDLAANHARCRLPGYIPHPQGAAFSPDGMTLATADGNREILLWDAGTLQPLGRLPGHSRSNPSLAFSPDGRDLVSGGADGTVKVWDLTAQEELLTLRGPFTGVGQVCFAPDGRTLVFWADHAEEGNRSVFLLPTALPEDLASDSPGP
jgi:WD40 repeat protein